MLGCTTSVLPGDIFTLNEIARFLSMLFIGIACLLMGAGVPTTALYIMLVTVAQPAFTNLGIPPLATHLFVFYYGIISEVTPPVCTSAYAAAAIANATVSSSSALRPSCSPRATRGRSSSRGWLRLTARSPGTSRLSPSWRS